MAGELHNRQTRPRSLKIENLSTSPADSSLLSPPSAGLSTRSPPPRAEGNDYFSSKRAKKRHEKGLRRPHNTPLHRSENSGSGEALLVYNAEPGSSRPRDLESAYDSIDDADLPTKTITLESPPALATFAAADQTGTVRRVKQKNPDSAAPYRPNLIHGPLDIHNNSDESPAVDYLRRISRPTIQKSRPMLLEFKALSKILTDKIHTLFQPKEKIVFRDVVDENIDGNNSFGFRRGSAGIASSNVDAPGDLSPTSKGTDVPASGLHIPASITLRKASGAASLNAGTDSQNLTSLDQYGVPNKQSLVTSTSTSNLVAFQSHRNHHAARIPSQEQPHKASSPTSSASYSTYKKNPPLRARIMSVTRLGNSHPSQPYVSPADTALTVTSFYPARPAPSKRQFRSNSMPAERPPFRFSVIQVFSRNSIHEVIWYEDESSTSGGSSGPVSPVNAAQTSHGPIPLGDLANGKQGNPVVSITTAPAKASDPPQTDEHDSKSPSLDPRSVQKRLLSWSWHDPQPSAADAPSVMVENDESFEHNSHRNITPSMRRAATTQFTSGDFPHRQGSDSPSIESPAANAQSVANAKTTTVAQGRTSEAFDRGLDMFKRRGVSLGSVRIARVGSSLNSEGRKT